jgi:DNA polymerase III alpha subunit (gram-positive type)
VQFIADNTPKVSKNMKPFLIGQNVDFDKGFFMQMMEYAGLVKEVAKYLRGHEDFYGNWQPDVLDTIILGQLALCATPNVTSYKLELMCERLGVELDDAHDADADVSATTNVVAVLTQRMRSIGGTIEGGPLNVTKTEKSRKHFKI